MGGEGASHQCIGDEDSLASPQHFPDQDCRRLILAYEWQRHSDVILEYTRGYNLQRHVQFSSGDCSVVGTVLGNYLGEMHSWVRDFPSRLVELSKPSPSH